MDPEFVHGDNRMWKKANQVQNMQNQYNTKVSCLSVPGLVRDFLLMFLWSLVASWSVSLDTFSISDRLCHDTSVWILHTTGGVDCNFVSFTEHLFLIWKCKLIRNFQAKTVLLSKYCLWPLFLSSLSLFLIDLSPPLSLSLPLFNILTLWCLWKPNCVFVMILYTFCWFWVQWSRQSQVKHVEEVSLWSSLSVWLSDLKH